MVDRPYVGFTMAMLTYIKTSDLKNRQSAEE